MNYTRMEEESEPPPTTVSMTSEGTTLTPSASEPAASLPAPSDVPAPVGVVIVNEMAQSDGSSGPAQIDVSAPVNGAVRPNGMSEEDMARRNTGVGFVDPMGDRYQQGEGSKESFRIRLQKVMDHLAFRVCMLVIILVDVCVTIASVVSSFQRMRVGGIDVAYDIVALVFSLFFVAEISARIFVVTKEVFFNWTTNKWNVVDFAVVCISLLVIIITFPIDLADLGEDYAPVVNIIRLLRVIRIVKVIQLIVQSRRARDATRMKISENKRRFMKDGFDLDLTYITDHVIAMSFPSSGVMSVYRNPIEQVSKFFKTKYPGGYRLYNLCSEMYYDGDRYFDGQVERVMIDDHNVPSLQMMLDFVKNVEEFRSVDRQRVIAIHCKGGKGRTGTMVSAVLLYNRMFESAQDALDYFAARRTDLSVGKKYQGVQTPSQSRYVHYFAKMLSVYGGNLPPEKIVRLTSISVTSLKGIGVGNGSDLIAIIRVSGRDVLRANFGAQEGCSTAFDETTSTVVATITNPPALSGDVKVRFESTSNIPCDYDNCPWFFWFNTSFLEENSLYIVRDDLDNPHKQKSWKYYSPTFGVGLSFQQSPADEFI